MKNRILIVYHCSARTGYAIETLEGVFWEMAVNFTGGNFSDIFLAYRSYPHGYPLYTPAGFENFYTFYFRENDRQKLKIFAEFVRKNRINVIFGFDHPPSLPYYRYARKAGVRKIVSYWGAPMSSINSGLKLWLKKMEIALYRWSPDVYIFESEAMRQSAYKGRGVSENRSVLCHLGVDTQKYKPDPDDRYYAHDLFGIARDQKLIFYSGHFEARKGVAVIAKAANILSGQRNDLSFVLFGNQPGQEAPYASILTDGARKKVVFGGYRKDLNRVHRSCYAGVIASTGWDSFTVSSLEIQASGLPLLVSDLPGLRESVIDGHTGFVFPAGDFRRLAGLLGDLADFPQKQQIHAKAARSCAKTKYSLDSQRSRLTSILQLQIAAG